MKKLFLFFAFLPFFSFAQEFSEVVEVPGKTAGQLYSTAREWFAKSFISTDNTLLMDDLISGKIIAKGSIPISEGQAAPVSYANFTIKVAFKDGKYKSEILDISIIRGVSEFSSGTSKPFKEYFDKKETYKKLGDPEWFMKNPPGVRIGKAAAKELAQPKQDLYNLICKTESEMMDLLSKLNQEMKKSEDVW